MPLQELNRQAEENERLDNECGNLKSKVAAAERRCFHMEHSLDDLLNLSSDCKKGHMREEDEEKANASSAMMSAGQVAGSLPKASMAEEVTGKAKKNRKGRQSTKSLRQSVIAATGGTTTACPLPAENEAAETLLGEAEKDQAFNQHLNNISAAAGQDGKDDEDGETSAAAKRGRQCTKNAEQGKMSNSLCVEAEISAAVVSPLRAESKVAEVLLDGAEPDADMVNHDQVFNQHLNSSSAAAGGEGKDDEDGETSAPARRGRQCTKNAEQGKMSNSLCVEAEISAAVVSPLRAESKVAEVLLDGAEPDADMVNHDQVFNQHLNNISAAAGQDGKDDEDGETSAAAKRGRQCTKNAEQGKMSNSLCVEAEISAAVVSPLRAESKVAEVLLDGAEPDADMVNHDQVFNQHLNSSSAAAGGEGKDDEDGETSAPARRGRQCTKNAEQGKMSNSLCVEAEISAAYVEAQESLATGAAGSNPLPAQKHVALLEEAEKDAEPVNQNQSADEQLQGGSMSVRGHESTDVGQHQAEIGLDKPADPCQGLAQAAGKAAKKKASSSLRQTGSSKRDRTMSKSKGMHADQLKSASLEKRQQQGKSTNTTGKGSKTTSQTKQECSMELEPFQTEMPFVAKQSRKLIIMLPVVIMLMILLAACSQLAEPSREDA